MTNTTATTKTAVTYGDVLRHELARLEHEITDIERALEALHPVGVEGRKAERETELLDALDEFETEREGILAELESDEDDEDDDDAA
jgi:hypothetical protein